MGFGFGGGFGKLFGGGKKAFGSLFGGVEGGLNALGEGALNTLTFGAMQQMKATEEAKKARDQAAQKYKAEIAAAEATAKKIAEDEEERKRRLAFVGTQMPSTLVNSYLGVSGPANIRKAMLG